MGRPASLYFNAFILWQNAMPQYKSIGTKTKGR